MCVWVKSPTCAWVVGQITIIRRRTLLTSPTPSLSEREMRREVADDRTMNASCVREHHRVDDPQHHHESKGERRPRECANRPDHDWLIGYNEVCLQLALRDELVVLGRLVVH